MEKTKLLVIAIATVAIITAATTTSLSAATPAFAKLNCNEDFSICSGGESFKARGLDIPGGTGSHVTQSFPNQETTSGGFGLNDGTSVGGGGVHRVCDPACQEVGGEGQHVQGPGGNSGNVPP